MWRARVLNKKVVEDKNRIYIQTPHSECGRMRGCLCNLALLLFTQTLIISALELVAYATDPTHQGLTLLRDTARWHGWRPLHVIGTQEGFQTHGLVDKVRALRRFAKRWPDDTILVFVDGYDVVVNNEPWALETAFLESGRRVLLASERGCCTDKATALAYGSACHPAWPFVENRRWLNSGVLVGYARDVRRLLRLAWSEYRAHPRLYQVYTDQQLLCHLVSEGSNLWTRAAVGIDHASALALTTYDMDIRHLGVDSFGRMVFENRTVPSLIHFNGPQPGKADQLGYARAHFPLLKKE